MDSCQERVLHVIECKCTYMLVFTNLRHMRDYENNHVCTSGLSGVIGGVQRTQPAEYC